jgi:hypothetical protein
MAFVHHPLFVIYVSSALMTVLSLGLIIQQRGRFKRISRRIGSLGELRDDFRLERDDIRSQLDDIQRRLAVLEARSSMKEQNCKLEIVA